MHGVSRSIYFSYSDRTRWCALVVEVHSCPSIVYVYEPCELFFLIKQLSIAVRVVLVDQQRWEQSSSSSFSITQVTHLSTLSSMSYSSFVDSLIINTSYTRSLFDVYKQQLTHLGSIAYFIFFLVGYLHVKSRLMYRLIWPNTRASMEKIIEE